MPSPYSIPESKTDFLRVALIKTHFAFFLSYAFLNDFSLLLAEFFIKKTFAAFSTQFNACILICFIYTGTLTVEEVYKDRDQFAALVREVAAPDVGRMGIEILSFIIKDVHDNVQYLDSLGKAQTASVRRDADTGVAEANR